MENKGKLWFWKWGTEQGMLQIFVLYHKTYEPPLTYLFNLLYLQTKFLLSGKLLQPLFKGPTVLNNYMPISKLSILSKVLESLVNDQLKEFLSSKNALSEFKSGFRKTHSTSTAIIKVLNDLMVSMGGCSRRNDITQRLKIVPCYIITSYLAAVYFQALCNIIAPAAPMVRQQSFLIITPEWKYSS